MDLLIGIADIMELSSWIEKLDNWIGNIIIHITVEFIDHESFDLFMKRVIM